ncbi:HAD family hydrolase [Flavisolibacter ginsenosidimutans]|uniref:HAD family phosphatase n=1 Tax=Flavisolibacter ginsenosidimutans TaxID=661481 RepID=A0A5B8UL98_9BACT|nr:HAD family phosphatase [Flavisolibacter ginsenosidimutans]QEC57481.1 HAD family phosphatase [Flavisolibacter ginsenosidimutans]
MNVTTIIFDLGGVLIDWNPAYVFDTLIPEEEKRKHFFENICTHEWNEEQDAGRTIKEANEVLIAKHPEWKEHIEAYYGRWEEMLGGPIEETVEIFRELKESGHYKMYALTNWSAETFPKALALYEFLHWFDGRLVSGEEKMRKPFPEFFQLLLDRFDIKKEEALFIDDNLRNAEAAKDFGLETIRFTSSAQLRDELERRAIL